MFGLKRKMEKEAVELIQMLDPEGKLWCSSAALISVKGKGVLKKEVRGVSGDENYGDYATALTLNKTPLVQMEERFCLHAPASLPPDTGLNMQSRKRSEKQENG
ncbi:hypothetical protein [Clostridium sp. AM58-1XD]|uniref:hypothetical protein n=1 Tax=Clostridium sp. AM58-1XD TaxID=2292307 RepID=UPI000E508945|nr:hypothetical protein [Clostridium sp. AM58-1XD]RGY95759.1 hypothetical protein DXA13_18415 [Clostridium sp. AM58-1XD]